MRIFTEVLRKICIFKTCSDYSLLPSPKYASPFYSSFEGIKTEGLIYSTADNLCGVVGYLVNFAR